MSAVEEVETAFLWRDEGMTPNPKRKHLTVLPNGAEVRLSISDYSNKWICIIYPSKNGTHVYCSGSGITPGDAIRDAIEGASEVVEGALKIQHTTETYGEALIASAIGM